VQFEVIPVRHDTITVVAIVLPPVESGAYCPVKGLSGEVMNTFFNFGDQSAPNQDDTHEADMLRRSIEQHLTDDAVADRSTSHTSLEQLQQATDGKVMVTGNEIAVQLATGEVATIFRNANPSAFQELHRIIEQVVAERDQAFDTAVWFSQDPAYHHSLWCNLAAAVADEAAKIINT
jgi:hypothetical protein